MYADRQLLDALEVRRRAAEVRRHWSVPERARRMGLPPDIPFLLRLWGTNAGARCMASARWAPQPVRVTLPFGGRR